MIEHNKIFVQGFGRGFRVPKNRAAMLATSIQLGILFKN